MLTVACQKSRVVFFATSIIRDILVFPTWSKFLMKLICWIGFGSASSFCFLLKSIKSKL